MRIGDGGSESLHEFLFDVLVYMVAAFVGLLVLACVTLFRPKQTLANTAPSSPGTLAAIGEAAGPPEEAKPPIILDPTSFAASFASSGLTSGPQDLTNDRAASTPPRKRRPAPALGDAVGPGRGRGRGRGPGRGRRSRASVGPGEVQHP